MYTSTLLIQVFLLLKTILHVKSQFMAGMPPMMGGMQFPQMPMSSMLRSPMAMGMPGMMPGLSMPMVPLIPDNKQKKSGKRKPKNKFRRKNKRASRSHYETQESYSDESTGSSAEDVSTRSDRRESRRSYRDTGIQNRRQVLTPVISYVTKDGYVIYQKKINQEKAKDWLSIGKGSQKDGTERMTSSEEILGDVLMKKLKKIRNRH